MNDGRGQQEVIFGVHDAVLQKNLYIICNKRNDALCCERIYLLFDSLTALYSPHSRNVAENDVKVWHDFCKAVYKMGWREKPIAR